MSVVPTGTVAPDRVTISSTTPACQISMSMSDFSVSTLATIWPRSNGSPTSTSHSMTVPSSMSAPSDGIA
jgi:hypothetical protein